MASKHTKPLKFSKSEASLRTHKIYEAKQSKTPNLKKIKDNHLRSKKPSTSSQCSQSNLTASSSTCEPALTTPYVQQRLDSARNLRRKTIINQVSEAEQTIAELLDEVSMLRMQQVRQAKELHKFESKNGDFGKLVHSHEERIRDLQEKCRQQQNQKKKLDSKLKKSDSIIMELTDHKKHYAELSDRNDLEEVNTLRDKINHIETLLEQKDKSKEELLHILNTGKNIFKDQLQAQQRRTSENMSKFYDLTKKVCVYRALPGKASRYSLKTEPSTESNSRNKPKQPESDTSVALSSPTRSKPKITAITHEDTVTQQKDNDQVRLWNSRDSVMSTAIDKEIEPGYVENFAATAPSDISDQSDLGLYSDTQVSLPTLSGSDDTKSKSKPKKLSKRECNMSSRLKSPTESNDSNLSGSEKSMSQITSRTQVAKKKDEKPTALWNSRRSQTSKSMNNLVTKPAEHEYKEENFTGIVNTYRSDKSNWKSKMLAQLKPQKHNITQTSSPTLTGSDNLKSMSEPKHLMKSHCSDMWTGLVGPASSYNSKLTGSAKSSSLITKGRRGESKAN